MSVFKLWLKAAIVLSAFAGGVAHAKTFCSMTLNSSDEIETFRKNLAGKGFDFVELVPDSKDPLWFKKSCDSGIQCDVLLISGHFGGLFFGEGTSTTIGIAEMEQASCNNSCPGILKNPKEVFLMGCNTLATQTKDHRTVEQYLNVLIEDGIPLDFAEQVAASRYSQQGFSLEKRFAAIFNNSSKLYGFASTGPLGASAAPRLRSYLNKVSSYSAHLDQLTTAPNTMLQSAFADTNFRETVPSKVLDADSRGLFCALRSDSIDTKSAALQRVVQENKVVTFFDSIANNVQGLKDGLLQSMNNSATTLRQSLTQTLAKISANNKNLITIQHEVLQVSRAVGLMDSETKLFKVAQLLKQAYAQDLNYSKVSQICGILKQEPELQNLDAKSIESLSKISPYFMLTLGCYPTLAKETKWFLFEKIYYPNAPFERTLALQILKPHWTQDDLSWVSAALGSNDPDLKMRIYLSARKLLYPSRNAILGGTALSRCILQSENEGGQSLGTNWGCLTDNNAELTVDVCDHFASLNPDPENSDDMRWYCWSKTKQRMLEQRPECYALANSMGIRGNQMKQVWNCGHR
ncbi:hypothetical protein [Bdellovibrio sp. NC01]|uniref:hypothetical protein n=1 Tax=Bdellovibrio sp. NC01 TaxID=2220073 RepID=UPI0011591063|nr:hypothetical protein [Bdellovibrio sp. NC01]QDK37770.1 hypothetical protein DOE51_09330 [Bdellovibrio sp. NC01]